ncbi:type II toxin-antitoxin system prevent-host-death family antitoxin [Patescibacteria group bacterium]|nr:type II toxin-antitoxin system prevent-host-death family antitoxin [Patescibacteria group bacterium]
MVKTLPITKVREKLTTLVQNANKKLDEYVITVNGSPAAALISSIEYESWKETNDILSDPVLIKAIAAGEKDLGKGRVYDWEEVKKELQLDV